MADPPWPTAGNGITSTYDLHCHCGAVKYKITLSPPLFAEETQPGKDERWSAVECSCSHCERTGAFNVHPLYDDLDFVQGKDKLVKYECGSRKNPHFNCKDCGSFLVTDLTEAMKNFGTPSRWAVNVSLAPVYCCRLVVMGLGQSPWSSFTDVEIEPIATHVERLRSGEDSSQTCLFHEECPAKVRSMIV